MYKNLELYELFYRGYLLANMTCNAFKDGSK